MNGPSQIAAAFDIGKRVSFLQHDEQRGTVCGFGEVVAVRGALVGVRGPSAYEVQPEDGTASVWVSSAYVDFNPL